MFLRLGFLTVTLTVLLTSNTAEAQPLNDPNRASAVCADTGSLQDVAAISLQVVKDGKMKRQIFLAENLIGAPVITVDGYVSGIVLLSNTPLDASVNHKPMNPIPIDPDGYYELKYYGNISRQDFWSTFMPPGREAPDTERIQGRYAIFPKVPGDALSHAPDFQIVLNYQSVSRKVTIRQEASVKMDLCRMRPSAGSSPEIYYLGNRPGQFDVKMEGFKQRMDAILTGIQSIEQKTGGRIVEAIHIIDLDTGRNAYSCNDENQIWLYNRVFWSEPIAELRVIAEHEAMHILSDRLGLADNSRMREMYADLMGFGLFSKERFYVIVSGTPPARKSDFRSPDTSNLFDFINEMNFIRGMNGGHSKDNMDEFCASFLHTLMYLDRLGSLLKAPIKSHAGASTQLSAAEQARLMADYERTLKAVIDAVKHGSPSSLTGFFQTCRETTHQAGLSLSARHVADLGDGK